MSIVLFAMIGLAIKAGIAYWVCFGLYCSLKLAEFLCSVSEINKEKE